MGSEGFCRPVSRVLYPSRKRRTVTIYLAQPPTVKPAVVRFWRSGVTAAVKQPTRGRAGRLCPPIWPCSRWGLAAAASPQTAGRSYRPISPLSRQVGTVCFCATFRLPTGRYHRRQKPGSYPAPCPEEPGLSSLLPQGKNGGHPVCMTLQLDSSIGDFGGRSKDKQKADDGF